MLVYYLSPASASQRDADESQLIPTITVYMSSLHEQFIIRVPVQIAALDDVKEIIDKTLQDKISQKYYDSCSSSIFMPMQKSMSKPMLKIKQKQSQGEELDTGDEVVLNGFYYSFNPIFNNSFTFLNRRLDSPTNIVNFINDDKVTVKVIRDYIQVGDDKVISLRTISDKIIKLSYWQHLIYSWLRQTQYIVEQVEKVLIMLDMFDELSHRFDFVEILNPNSDKPVSVRRRGGDVVVRTTYDRENSVEDYFLPFLGLVMLHLAPHTYEWRFANSPTLIENLRMEITDFLSTGLDEDYEDEPWDVSRYFVNFSSYVKTAEPDNKIYKISKKCFLIRKCFFESRRRDYNAYFPVLFIFANDYVYDKMYKFLKEMSWLYSEMTFYEEWVYMLRTTFEAIIRNKIKVKVTNERNFYYVLLY